MKRITLSAAAARLVEQHVSAYEDARDEKGKPLREPKERRQWDRLAVLFEDAAGVADEKIEALRSAAMTWGRTVQDERAALLEQLQGQWRKDGADPEVVSRAVTALNASFDVRISARENAIAIDIQGIEEGEHGKALSDIDLDDPQLDLVKKVWPEIDLNTSSRRARRLNNEVKDALDGAAELVKVDGNYVPKKRLSVVESEAGG